MARLKIRREKRDIIKATNKATAQLVSKLVLQGEANAKQIVRVDTGALRASITSESKGPRGKFYTDIIYNKAQEYGLPGTAYKFRPYMRPAGIALKRIVGKLARSVFPKKYARARLRRV